MISHVGLSELSHTTWYSSYCAITYDPSTKRSQTRNTSNGNKYMFDYWYSIIMAHMKKKKKKICRNKNYVTYRKIIIFI